MILLITDVTLDYNYYIRTRKNWAKVEKENKNFTELDLERLVICSEANAWNILQPNWKSSAQNRIKIFRM